MEVRKGYKQTEVGIIPIEWNVYPLIACSKRIKDGDHWTPRRSESGYFLLSARNILNSRIDLTDVDFVEEDEYRRMRQRCNPEEGDILISCSGTIGRVAVLPRGLECVMVRSAAMVKPDPLKLNGFFAQYFLQSAIGQKQISLRVNQGAQPNLFLNHIETLPVPLPSTLAEQEAIAEALSDADALIESLETLLAKKRQVKQGAMSELLTGKRRLVESGEWEVKKLGDLVVLSKAGINPASRPETLFAHFSLPAFDAGATPISEQGNQIGSNKFLVPENAVMISKLNPRIPRIWAPEYIPDNSVCSTEFLVLVPRENINRYFLAVLCQSPTVSYQMELHAIGTTGSHQRINPSQALAIEVQVPTDKAEQTAIAEILSDMDAEIAMLEGKLSKARQVKAGMMSELLTGRVRLV